MTDPTNARNEVEALTAELAGLEALNAKHQAAATEAARAHRAGTLDADALQAATSAAAAVAYALTQTRADLEAARAALAEAESAAEDEAALAEIAAGTIAFAEAQEAHRGLLDQMEHGIARAIARSAELTADASAAKTRAHDAAVALAAKHASTEAAMLARAVNGSDVEPMRADASVIRWPFGRRQVYRLVSQIEPSTRGVKGA